MTHVFRHVSGGGDDGGLDGGGTDGGGEMGGAGGTDGGGGGVQNARTLHLHTCAPFVFSWLYSHKWERRIHKHTEHEGTQI